MTLEHAVRDYQAKTPRSRQLFEDALRVMPGGNSRTTTFFDPYPFYITRGSGARIWDADGNERVDFNGNYTSLILGHANPAVVKAIQDAAVNGMSFPGPSEHEIRLADILTKRIPTMEVVRFANSGTEATMHAIRVARAFTGRSKIAKFEGAYHGTHDWVLVSVATPEGEGGSRKRPKSVAWSAGVPGAVLKHVVVLPWNDLDACVKILEKEARDLAALIIDPLLANAGMATIYVSILGKAGLRKVGELATAKAHYAAERFAAVPGVSLRFNAPFFKEFALTLPKAPDRVVKRLLKDGILAGVPLKTFDRAEKSTLLVAVTERRTKDEIDAYAAALAAAVA